MEILIISGLSGSGKSRAAGILEDIGYYIVDNLPAELIVRFADFCAGVQGRYDRVTLVYDVRAGEPFDLLIAALERLKETSVECRLLFLEAQTPTIISRYKETRRSHPLASEGRTLEQAVALERERLQGVRVHADYVLDTTTFTNAKLRQEMLQLFGSEDDRQEMHVDVMSFGYKRGLPLEADLVYDVRFMPNPFYVPELKHKTGLDGDVAQFVFDSPQSVVFMEQLRKMTEFLLPLYKQEGKTVLVIAIGCTGGHHRSVAVCHALAEHIEKLGYPVTESHRDISR